MPDAISIPVIATVKNEVERFAALPSAATGPELVVLTAQDGANVPGLYSNTGTAYELVSSGGGSVVEVTPSATLPSAYVTEIINLLAVDGANQPGLYRWDGAAYVPAATASASDTDSYLHTQAVAATVWTVIHNLGYQPPGVHIEDTAGLDMSGNVNHISANQLTITFAVAVAGTARVG